MSVGDVSGIVRTKQGFLILTVTDRQPTCAPTRLASQIANGQTNPDLSRYIDMMEERINGEWYKLIPKAARLRQGSLAVEFSVQRDGSITERKVASSSGDAGLDEAGLRAIGKAAPFPPLPDSLEWDHLNLRFLFQYNLSASSRSQ